MNLEILNKAKKKNADNPVLEAMKQEEETILCLFNAKENTPDETLNVNYKCKTCNKRQNIKPGVGEAIEKEYYFQNEIMGKSVYR